MFDETIGAADLFLRYQTALRMLITLLGTQPPRLRQAAVRGFCEWLHVPNYGDTQGAVCMNLCSICDHLHFLLLHVRACVECLRVRSTSGGGGSTAAGSNLASENPSEPSPPGGRVC